MPPTVLLADDSLTIQRVVSLTFADQSIRVVVAKDGQDAINRMTTERPDLVLADTNMPCVDGYELARWVRQQPHLNTVPVLLLAGATDPVDEQRLHDSGANGVLEKPFEPSHVISRVKELLGLKTPPAAAATRLVTSPETTPAPRPTPAARPGGAGMSDRPEALPATPAEPPAAASVPKKPASGIFRTLATVADPPAPGGTTPATQDQIAPPAAAEEPLGGLGDARDWFAGHEPGPTSDERALLAEELGVSGPRFHAPGDDRRSSAPPGAPSSAADVFESLLAAEQGDPAAVVIRSAAPELTPEMLDHLAARIVERLRPDVLRDELQRGLGLGLRETVSEIVGDAVRDAVAAAVPQAVLDAVRGDAGPQVNEIVHDTAERLVREEIARIRERR